MNITDVKVVGVKKGHAHWLKMRDAWHACKAAGLDMPMSLSEFFNGQPPDEDSQREVLMKGISEWSGKDGSYDCIEIDLTQLPPDYEKLEVHLVW